MHLTNMSDIVVLSLFVIPYIIEKRQQKKSASGAVAEGEGSSAGGKYKEKLMALKDKVIAFIPKYSDLQKKSN